MSLVVLQHSYSGCHFWKACAMLQVIVFTVLRLSLCRSPDFEFNGIIHKPLRLVMPLPATEQWSLVIIYIFFYKNKFL